MSYLKMTYLVLIFLSIISCSSVSKKAKQELKETVAFQSKLGKAIFSQSKAKDDFFRLANNFTFQPNKILCGPTTMSIILNTLNIPQPPYVHFHSKDIKHLPRKLDPRIKRFSPRNVLSEKTDKIKSVAHVFGKLESSRRDPGLQLSQLDGMFKAYGIKTKRVIVADEVKFKKVRKMLIKAVQSKKYLVVVNYARKQLGQAGGAHISPIGAYDELTDSVLIMDVNPSKAQWVWVGLRQLFKAMKTYDTLENRGFIVLKS